jgi:type IV pilus assembly protein PilM
MAIPRFAWGIDIGNRALKAIKLVRDGDALRMDDIEVIEHEQVLSNSGDNRESLVQTALANFAQRHMTKGGVVSVGVSGQSSFARFIKLPPVEEKKIPEIVKFEAIQQIPFPLDQVEWSYQLFRQPDSPDVEVGIFAMRKELVNQQIKYFTDMDMNVQVVQMSPLAVYNAMYYDNRLSDGTTMILDLGAENADLIIAEGDSVWLRSVPIGGNNFTEALVKSFKLSFSKAEDLKRNAQTSKYARQIFQAMRPIFADLVAEIQRSIGFYSSVHRDSRIKRIVALGNTFRLPTLQKYLQLNLQIEVDRLDTFQAGAPADGRLAALLNDNIASMAGAYGLALQAMGQGKIDSSLLPQEIRKAKIWQEKTKWFAIAAGIAVVAAGVMYGNYYLNNDKFESNSPLESQISSAVGTATNLDSQWSQLESSGGPDKNKIVNINSLQTYRDVWTNLWLDITRTLPAENAQDPAKLKSTPRADRKQIFIESLNSQYQPDISAALKMDADNFKLLAQPSAGPGGGQLQAAYAPTAGGGDRGMNPGRGRTGWEEPAYSRRSYMQPQGDSTAGSNTGDGTTPAAPTERGYLITIELTSPNKAAPTLVDTNMLKVLLESDSLTNALKDHKRYYIPRAMIVKAQQIQSDETRKAFLKQAFDTKKAEQERAKQPVDPSQGFPTGGGEFGGRGNYGRGNYGRGDSGRGYGGRSGYPRGGYPSDRNFRGTPALPPTIQRPGGLGTGTDTADQDKANAEAYMDPLYPTEQVLNDWEMTVVIAVVLDPKQPDATAAATNGTSTVAPEGTPAGSPAEDRRDPASRS